MKRPPVSAVLTVMFAAGAAWIARTQDLVDDEGYITYLGAVVMQQEPLACFFFQKFHPPLSLLYAPAAAFGWRTFLAAHSVFGAIGVYLAGAVAQRVGGSGAAASAVFALSPVYLLAAASGQSNSDGITLLLLAFWLSSFRERRGLMVLAGLVLAAAVWARYEFALAAGLFGLHAALDPKSRWCLVGLLAGPALYLLAGAAYHHDPLWFLRLPPTLSQPLPGMNLDAVFPRTPAQLVMAAVQLSLVSVAWLLPFGVDPAALDPAARRLRAALFVTLGAMVLVPFTRRLNFEHHPRYLAATLPFAAAVAGLWVAAPSRRRSLALAPLAALAPLTPRSRELAWLLAVAALMPVGALLPSRRARTALVIAVAAAALAFTEIAAPITRGSRLGDGAAAAARWLDANARGRTVYTNDQRLALTLAVRGRTPRYLAASDIQMELLALLNPHNGQRDAMLRAITPRLYGEAAWVCEFARRPPPPRSLFVLGRDERILRYFPPRVWDAHTHAVASFGDVRVRELNDGDRGFGPQLDRVLGISPAQREAPCRALDAGGR